MPVAFLAPEGRPNSETEREEIKLGALRGPMMIGGLVVGVIGLVAALGAAYAGGPSDAEAGASWFKSFSASYLVSFCFFASIAIGGLFWVIIMHLTRAGWGVCLRRLFEILAMITFPMLILFLPILAPP